MVAMVLRRQTRQSVESKTLYTDLVKLANTESPTRKFQVYLFLTPIWLSAVSSEPLNTDPNF